MTWPSAGRGGETTTETLLDSLALDPDGPSVVAIGGGHGLAAALQAIQLYAGQVTAIVSVADDGGSSGRLIEGLDMPAPGDIRRCLLALTVEPSILTELFAHRFGAGDVSDHSLGNLMLAGLTELYGDFTAAVDAAQTLLGTIGDVVPAVTSRVGLRAVVDGEPLEGQAAISKTHGRIEAIELVPGDVSPDPRALDALATADQIVIGPGSLFTSVVAALLVPGLSAAVMASPAQRVFVSNLITQDGETLGLSGEDHLDVLAKHGGIDGPGLVLVHDGPLAVPPIASRVEYHTARTGLWEIRGADMADRTAAWPEHDPMALAQALERLLD